MSFSYVSDDPSRLSVDDVLGLIDWKELENVLSSPDDTSRLPVAVDVPMAPMDVEPIMVEPNARPAPPRRARKMSRSKMQTPTAAYQPVAAPPAGLPVKKKRIRREIVELKFLRGKAKELEEELHKLQLGFSTSPRAEGESVSLDGLMPSVWTSMAGRQLKDRMRAERENQELRSMLQDQLKIAQGLEDTLKQLPPSQGGCNQPASILPPDLFGPSSSETLAESLAHLERSYLSVNEAFTTESVDNLEMDKHEIKAILHPSFGTCIRFTTRIAMPFNYDVTSRAMWRFITEEGLISLASSFNKIYSTKDTQAHCFAFRLPDSDPAKDYWLSQVVRKHLESDRMVIVGRSTIHPYVKDNRHPTGVSFIDDARISVSDSSSNDVPQSCVKACVYLVPDFGSGSSDETVGINDLLEFFIQSASPVILRCRAMIMTMLRQEAEAVKHTERSHRSQLLGLNDVRKSSSYTSAGDGDARPRNTKRAAPSAGFTCPDRIQSSGKKCVRRIQLELPFYGQQVAELELKLKRVELQKLPGNTSRVHFSRDEDQMDTDSVWNGITERQLKKRLRAKQQNEGLQTSYKELVGFSTELQTLLRRSEDSKQELIERIQWTPRHWFRNLTTEADEDIFSEQLTIVARLCLKLQQHSYQTPDRSIHLGWDLSLGEKVVTFDPSIKAGVVLESRSGTALLFTLDTGSLVRSFSLHTNFEGFFSQLVGKYTCRKFVTENEVTLMWVELADVEEFGGAKFTGMQYLKQGYLKLRKVPPGQQSTSTVAEAYSKNIPVFQDDIIKQEEQTQDLIRAVKRLYGNVNKVFCQTMSNMLLEEDWKASAW
ncbi:hypothetical protein PHYPSEUDO_012326 [Phytophthora pseudosyringae]|uniref:M96 mating-specific protein family n=1 Tax=Phytophthora pseudosyringae TaxID=221518 RepID=A0A8T1VA97_9STRA|nr:hypothetical protein PHYPSEUDO_012326 [Phytophthora pseudosyringae]